MSDSDIIQFNIPDSPKPRETLREYMEREYGIENKELRATVERLAERVGKLERVVDVLLQKQVPADLRGTVRVSVD